MFSITSRSVANAPSPNKNACILQDRRRLGHTWQWLMSFTFRYTMLDIYRWHNKTYVTRDILSLRSYIPQQKQQHTKSNNDGDATLFHLRRTIEPPKYRLLASLANMIEEQKTETVPIKKCETQRVVTLIKSQMRRIRVVQSEISTKCSAQYM